MPGVVVRAGTDGFGVAAAAPVALPEAPRPAPADVVGWREWVGLPDLGVARIKAKVDTGARSSALHAWNLEEFQRDGVRFVRFVVHPWQRDVETSIVCECEWVAERSVRSSHGHSETRPVVRTTIEVGGRRWPIELTLTNRDTMGFRMLVGRLAVRARFLVDPSRSFVQPRPRSPARRRRRAPSYDGAADGSRHAAGAPRPRTGAAPESYDGDADGRSRHAAGAPRPRTGAAPESYDGDADVRPRT